MAPDTLTARKVNDDPPGYRMIYDDGTGPVEVGSVSAMVRHTKQNEKYWHWGVDTMPLMDRGGRVPSGDTWSREAALQAFREAFFRWLDKHADAWPSNRDYMKAMLVGRK